MKPDTERSVWVVSSEPASTNLGTDRTSLPSVSFREKVPIHKLKELVREFASDVSEIFEVVDTVRGAFQVDSVEVNAVMAADGKLGILGSAIGSKIEGSVKFVLKRVNQEMEE